MTIDPIDQLPQGDPETVVSLPNGETLISLMIRDVDEYPMLPIRLDVLGRPVSVAREGLTIEFDNITSDVPLHSNPKRVIDNEDGA